LRERRRVTDPPETDFSEEIRWVESARGGDRQAFESLYARYAPMVHGVLLARVPRVEVEDLVQDVFVLVFRRLPALRDAAAFPGWLAAIARNRAADHLRRNRRGEELPGEIAWEDPGQMEAEEILEIVRSLPETYRETLILRLVEGMTGPEIAARTGLTPGSVRVNLHRGMARVRELLGRKKSHG
jgi:RNA polymerase sigma-70 factor (ECF subfamily)